MKRYALTLKIFLGFFAVLALSIVLLGWRLSIGPIALDWAGDYLRSALNAQENTSKIDFRDAVLIWQKSDRRTQDSTSGLQIIFYEIKIDDPEANISLNLPEAGARFSGLAMLRGLLAPTDIEMSNLTLDYDLSPDIWQSTDSRPFVEKIEELIKNIQQSNNMLVQMSQQLLTPPHSSEPAGYLQQISLLNTTINITDQMSGQKWQIPAADLNLRRTEQGLMINLFGDIAMGDSSLMPVDMSLLYNNEQKQAVTTFEFSDLQPSALAGKVEALADLRNLEIPASGSLQFSIDQDITIPVMTFNLALAKGHINPNNIYEDPLHISSATLAGYVQKSENSIVLEEIALALGETLIHGTGLLYGTMEEPGIAIKADINNLPFVDLKSYWPGKFGKGAYLWISKNIDAGVVPTGLLEVYITPEMWKADSLPANSVTFNFDFLDITAHYLRPMPLLTHMSGEAKLNLNQFRLTAQDGKIDGLDLRKADLLFKDIDKKGLSTAHITLDLEGALEEVLRVIDHKPLGYPSRYGIVPGSVQGKAAATVELIFPLIRKIKLADVVFDVKAEISELSIPKLTESLRLDGGIMTLHVDGNGLNSSGTIKLNDIDFAAVWQENFAKDAEYSSQYALQGLVEGAQWEQLNLPFDPYIEGPVSVDLALFGNGGAMEKGQGKFDLINSHSVFVPLGWDKEKGLPGSATFNLTFAAPGEINITDLHLQSAELEADMELDVKEDWITRLSIPHLTMTNTDFAMQMTWNPEEKLYHSTLTGKALNAIPLIDIITAPAAGGEKFILPDFDLSANIRTITAKNDITLQDITVVTQYREQDFTHVALKGAQGDDKHIQITIEPKEDIRLLTFVSNDAGEALRGLGLFNIGVGGDMVLTADMVTHEEGISLGGKAKIKDFKVIESPEFSKLLEEKKFEKAQEELKKGGLSFSDFDMNFRQFNGVMEISKGRARGPMLGMTIDGVVDQSYDEVSIKGTLIPAYGLNSLLGNIPLIGTILTGGKGQGIFAATYSIKGSVDKPEIKINPLAALAPGILRTIFSAIGSTKKKTLREQAEELEKVIPNTSNPKP